MIEDLPILLNFRAKENKLVLRLDNFGLRNFEYAEQSICELILNEFTDKDNLLDDFKELTGEVFEYELNSENDKTILEYYGDYGRIQNTIECKFVEKTFSVYTIEDLYHKGKNLADSFSDLYERFVQNEYIDSTLRNKLKIELKDEIERFHRKANFFEDKDKGKSEAFYSQIKLLQRLLNFLEKPL